MRHNSPYIVSVPGAALVQNDPQAHYKYGLITYVLIWPCTETDAIKTLCIVNECEERTHFQLFQGIFSTFEPKIQNHSVNFREIPSTWVIIIKR